MNGRLIVAFLVGIPLVLAVGATLLPRVGPHEIMRHQVTRLAEEIFPAPVAWDRVEISMDPPEIQIVNVTAGSAETSAFWWRIEIVRLVVVPESLRRGLVRVKEVTLSKAELDVVGGPLNAVGALVAPRVRKEDHSDPEAAADEKSLFDFALRIEDGTIRVHDTRVDPPEVLVFTKTQLRLDPEAAGSVVKGSARVRPEGRIDAAGRVSLEGDFELNLSVKGLDLAILPRYLAGLQSASGTLSGPISIRGKGGQVSAGTATLRGDPARLALKSLVVDGPLGLEVTLATGPGGAVRGRVTIDANDASLVVEDAYRKAPGTPALAHGDFAIDPEGGFELGGVGLGGPRPPH